jgi:hypothetical protein
VADAGGADLEDHEVRTASRPQPKHGTNRSTLSTTSATMVPVLSTTV